MAGHRSKKKHGWVPPFKNDMYIIFNLKFMYDMIQVIGKIMNLAQMSSRLKKKAQMSS